MLILDKKGSHIEKVKKKLDRLITVILKPGDLICEFFNIQKGEQRDFMRLYLNLFIYTKVAVGLSVALAIFL